MAELALRRVLARQRRRRRRPPAWWIALFFFAWWTGFAVFDAVIGELALCASQVSFAVCWWRALHNPPTYLPTRSGVWVAIGFAFLVAGLVAD